MGYCSIRAIDEKKQKNRLDWWYCIARMEYRKNYNFSLFSSCFASYLINQKKRIESLLYMAQIEAQKYIERSKVVQPKLGQMQKFNFESVYQPE